MVKDKDIYIYIYIYIYKEKEEKRKKRKRKNTTRWVCISRCTTPAETWMAWMEEGGASVY